MVVRCGTEDQLFRHDPFTGDDPELLAGCHEYLGSFWRTSTLGAEDLRPLRSVLIIRGDAHVNGLYSLLSLTGTECLTEVGGDLSLAWLRHDFLDVDGLHALRRVGGDVAIVANAWAERMTGLSALEEIGGDLRLEEMSYLETLEGALPSLRRVGGDLVLRELPLISAEEAERFVARFDVAGDIVIDLPSR